jgi:hypothetical protein
MSQFVPFFNPQQIKLSLTSDGHLLLELLEDEEQSDRSDPMLTSHRLLLDAKARVHLLASLKEALSEPHLLKVPRRVLRDQPPTFSSPDNRSQLSANSSSTVDLETRFTETLRGLEKPFQFERSIQYQRNRIKAGRMLAGYDLTLQSSLNKQSILQLLHQLCFPADRRDEFEAMLPSSHYLHLGFEPYLDSALYKVYLESDCDADSDLPIRYRAWKYLPFERKCFTTIYTRLLVSSPSQLSQLLLAHFSRFSRDVSIEPDLGELLQSLSAITERCFDIRDDDSFELLYATEDQSVRQSFDLNVYGSGLTVGTILEDLLLMCNALGLDRQRCLLSLQHCLSLSLGHISFGYHRKKEPFFTLYYGAASVV